MPGAARAQAQHEQQQQDLRQPAQHRQDEHRQEDDAGDFEHHQAAPIIRTGRHQQADACRIPGALISPLEAREMGQRAGGSLTIAAKELLKRASSRISGIADLSALAFSSLPVLEFAVATLASRLSVQPLASSARGAVLISAMSLGHSEIMPLAVPT